MPRIPVVDPSNKASVPRALVHTPSEYGAQLFESLGPLAQSFERVTARINQQQEKLDVARMTGELDAGIQQLKLELAKDTDYPTQAQRFAESAVALQERIYTGTASAAARNTFTAYASRRVPGDLVDVQAKSLELWMGKQKAELAALSETQLTLASLAETDQDRERLEKVYLDAADALRDGGTLLPQEHQALTNAWKEKVAASTALRQFDTDPGGPEAVAKRLRDAEGIFARLDPVKREALAKAGEVEAYERGQRLRQYQHDELVALHQENAKYAAENKVRQDLELGDMYLRVMQGENIAPRILERGRQLDPDKIPALLHFHRWWTTMGEVDDPKIVNQVLRQVTADVPLITVEALGTMPGLSNDTRRTLMFHVQSVRRALASEGKSLRMQELSQASAGLSNFFDKSLARLQSHQSQIGELENMARQEFLRRTIPDPSNPAAERESPYAVYQELVGRYAPRMTEFSRMTYTQIESTLPQRYRGPQGEKNLMDDVKAKAIKEEPAEFYAMQLRRLNDLREAQQLDQSGAVKPAAPGSAPSSAPGGAAAVPGRKRLP